MRHEIVTRLSTILLHSNEGVKPIGGLEVFHIGNLGVSFSLRGKGFYEALAREGLKSFQDAGIDTMLMAVSPVHYRAMRMGVKHASIRKLGQIRLGANTFLLLVVRDNEATGPDPFSNVKE